MSDEGMKLDQSWSIKKLSIIGNRIIEANSMLSELINELESSSPDIILFRDSFIELFTILEIPLQRIQRYLDKESKQDE